MDRQNNPNMRIRTIKPEFWTHPVMSRLCDTTKIVALGLLNYADDDGYFYADPRMVRAAIRPLDDDSKTTATAINELASSGYIEVRNHFTHGAVGRITAFKRHQVINRPNKSAISHLFAEAITEAITEQSRSDHGAVTEESGGGWKGSSEGIKGKEKGKGAPVAHLIVYPLNLDTKEFAAAWESWVAYRLERKLATLKPMSVQAQLAKLALWGHAAAVESIRQSIEQSYQGLFEPKASGGGYGKPRPAGTSDEISKKLGYQDGM
jgi:hypothetical protein